MYLLLWIPPGSDYCGQRGIVVVCVFSSLLLRFLIATSRSLSVHNNHFQVESKATDTYIIQCCMYPSLWISLGSDNSGWRGIVM